MRGTIAKGMEREEIDLLDLEWRLFGVWCVIVRQVFIYEKMNDIGKGNHVTMKTTLLTKVIVSLSLPTRKDKVIYMVESCKTLLWNEMKWNEWMCYFVFYALYPPSHKLHAKYTLPIIAWPIISIILISQTKIMCHSICW
jgi:hypothetical protein